MAAAILLNPHYEPKVYNGLRSVEEVEKELSREQISGLLKIVAKFGYEQKVLAIIAHNHFRLDETEAMLEMGMPDGKEGFIVRPYPMEKIEEMKAKPNVIALGDDGTGKGRWYPVNYALGEPDVSAWADEGFLKECADYLVANGLQGKLMLGARSAHLIDGQKDVLYMEKNYEDTRTSEMRPVLEGNVMPANAIQTTFKFQLAPDGNGQMLPAIYCIYTCWRYGGGHSRHHRWV